MSAYLRLLEGEAPAARYELSDDRSAVLGRGEGCDVRIDNRALSRQHCKIELRDDGWHVVDLESTNGTRVGGFKVSDTVLDYGEEIQIGALRFQFLPGPVPLLPELSSEYPLAGRHFGRFELLAVVHKGRSGTVYHAREKEKNRDVALKLLSPELTADDEAMQRFERGIHTVAPIHHPGVVQLYGTGKTDGTWWLAMERVDGPSVRELMARQGTLLPSQSIEIVRDVAAALDVAAARGIVHRNIKPSSILIGSDGRARLGDFVLARGVVQETLDRITQTGQIVGDVEYLAPECFRESEPVDCRTDIYSLGVCLYHMLGGRPPFQEPNIIRAMERVLNEGPKPLRQLNSVVPEPLEAVVHKCLAKDRAHRYQTPGELAEALAGLERLDRAPTAPSAAEPPEPAEAEPPTAPTIAATPDEELPAIVPTTTETTQFFRKVMAPPAVTHPAVRPWRVLAASAMLVVVAGSVVVLLFGERLGVWHRPLDGGSDSRGGAARSASDPAATGHEADSDSTGRPPARKTPPRASAGSGRTSRPAVALPESPALSDPNRLVVQPGTPLRNIADALGAVQDGQAIEVASSDAVAGELKLPAKSLTLVANREFQPVLHNTLRVTGGGTVRIEGLHFEPRQVHKPAIEIENMPDRLELAGCTFRDLLGGTLIIVGRDARAKSGTPQITLERSFVAGNILFALADTPADLRLVNNLLVADQTAFDWELSPEGTKPDDRRGILLRNNTIAARTVFSVRLADENKPIAELPATSIRLDDNIFVALSQYPCAFFRWESWQRPDVPLDRFQWSGGSNAITGLRPFTMATTLALKDRGATAQPFLSTPEEWQSRWAKGVAAPHLVPPEFSYTGKPKDIAEIDPSDYEPDDKSKLRTLGTDSKPLGADIGTLPMVPPAKSP